MVGKILFVYFFKWEIVTHGDWGTEGNMYQAPNVDPSGVLGRGGLTTRVEVSEPSLTPVIPFLPGKYLVEDPCGSRFRF